MRPCLGAGAGALLLAPLLFFGPPAAQAAPDVLSFDWGAIAPSPKLKWHACYDEFRCARLLVPLDWTDPPDGREVAIAMIKLPAVVDDENPTPGSNSLSPSSVFGGTIFTNPGGPGGSGVKFALAEAHLLRDIADTPPQPSDSPAPEDGGGDRAAWTPGRRYEILRYVFQVVLSSLVMLSRGCLKE